MVAKMKMTILLIGVLLFTASALNAQNHNAPVETNSEYITNVIVPLSCINPEKSITFDIINGQIINLNGNADDRQWHFTVSGEANKEVLIEFEGPICPDSDAPDCIGTWFGPDGNAASANSAQYVLPSGGSLSVYFELLSIDANGAANGGYNYTLGIDYSYVGF